ncbi:MAG: hypothetical protein H0V44_17480 [Planctomycetes bacterium]|nr:hypothetical protein [Planctomycetota bacterium]
MSSSATERTLRGLLVRGIAYALPRQASEGEFLIAPAINPYKVFYDQQVNAGIAYCLSHRFAGNPYFHHARACAAMERSLSYMLDAGRLATPAADGGLEHRNLRASITVVRLAGDLLTPRLRRSLAASHQACLVVLRKRMRRYRDVTVFDARTLDTGTNHFWGYLAITALLARHLEDESVLAELLPFAERFARAQDRTGHWTENAGPTSVYTRVSAHFMGLVAEVFPTAVMKRAARRAVDFQIDFSFPDGSSIECFDERVQAHESFYGLSQYLLGLTVMPHHPRGREYFAFLVDRLSRVCGGKTFASLEFTHFIVDALARMESLRTPAAWKPADAQAHGDGFGTVRTGRWQVGYQALPTRAWPGNPFFLDRQSLFSLWHDRAERVVDGSNSKRQPEIGTFAASRDDGAFADPVESLPIRGRWRRGRGLGTLVVDYRSFRAELAFLPRGDDLVLRVRTRPRGRPLARLLLNVRLPFRFGQRVRSESGATVVLDEHAPVEFTALQSGWIDNRSVRFSASTPFRATWPYLPFSSYRAPLYQREAADAWFAATCEIDARKPAALELRWRILP